MTTSRKVKEDDVFQGAEEKIAYDLTTTPWGSSPTNVVVECYDVTNGGRISGSANLSGVASVSGDVITLPILENLIPNKRYRLEIEFVCGGNTFRTFQIIQSEF
jgi:hypothetical protein